WKLLAELMKQGTTIFLTTPYLDEAERSTRVALMNKGEILACDTPDNVRAMLGQKVIEAVCEPVRKGLHVAREDAEMQATFEDVQMLGERLDFLFTEGTVPQA